MISLDQLPEVTPEDLIDPSKLSDLRARTWAARSPRGIEVLGYDQGMQVLEHPALLKGPSFQYRLDQLGIQGEARRYMDMGVTNKEGDERRQMRASLGALFRPAQIAKLRTTIRAIADAVLDDIDDPTDFELMRLCWEVPARTYCELVSIPYSESDTVVRIADSVLGTLLNVDRTRREEAEAAILESVDIVRRHLDARRGDPRDDFTSVMIRQQEQGLMSEEQLVAQSFALLQASVDNTAHQMGNTFGMLLSDRARWESFLSDRALRGPIIEEAIRLHPRFGTIFRLAADDVVIDDVVIPRGAWAFVSVRAGQRDPEAFDDPHDYRLDRTAKRPLMFGAGPYNCLGQNLARMEIEESMDAIADRFPGVTLIRSWGRKQANAVSETSTLAVDLGRPSLLEATTREAVLGATPESPTANPAHLAPGEVLIECRIAALTRVAEDIVAIDLVATTGEALPAWAAGAHIDLLLAEGRVRQYSLCGRPGDTTYRVAVLREKQGTGGSAYVHDRLSMSQRVQIRGPRNNFPLHDAAGYLFIAAGIGITPILPMVREAQRRGADWNLIYLGRERRTMAFLDEIDGMPSDRVQVIETGRTQRPSMKRLLSGSAAGVQLYACGPATLLADITASGWPADALHLERFEPDAAALAAPRTAFVVSLATTGRSIEVGSDESILDVLEKNGISWPYSCREGTCGTCEARILTGSADHRDAILTPAERARNEYMMVCVSRAATAELEIEI